MDNLTFETLNNAWNAIRTSGAPNLRSLISGLIDPGRIIMQRVAETPETMTVMFKGFDQALDDPENEAPLLKRAILAWVKKFANAQIERSGDQLNFILRIIKTQTSQPAAQVAENKKWQAIEEALMERPARKTPKGPLCHISSVRTTHGR